MVSKEIIKNNFSKYAYSYDEYSDIQNICASELIEKVDINIFGKILDIGCGTGNYTRLLRGKFPGAEIKAVDISMEMIEIAKKKLEKKNIEFIIADGEEINLVERFDLISSNVSFQWFENLNKALLRYRKVLNKKGTILFSIFGPRTFYELNKSLRELLGEDISISSCAFLGKEKIKKMLNGLFRKTQIEQKVYKEKHPSLKELLKKIKYSGIRGSGSNARNLWSPWILADLEKIYKEKFKEIIVTYEVFFCKGER